MLIELRKPPQASLAALKGTLAAKQQAVEDMRGEFQRREQVLEDREVERGRVEEIITSLQMELRNVSNDGCLDRTVPDDVVGILFDCPVG